MKKLLKHKIIWFAAAALVLIASLRIPSAMAYFTTYVTAKGGYPVTLGASTTIEEDLANMTKHIMISNTGESDCYVRVKVFCGSQFKIRYASAMADDRNPFWNLEESDGYWYYKNILPMGETTEELLAEIEVPKDQKESFDIVVIQECTPVLYGADGKPYGDWSQKTDTRTDIGREKGEGADGE